MNDFERKLSQQPFRTLPVDWRADVLGIPANVVAVPSASWRDWFWPSPRAWGALAALWLLLATLQLGSRPTSPTAKQAPEPAPAVQTSPTLLSFHNAREFRHVLDFPN